MATELVGLTEAVGLLASRGDSVSLSSLSRYVERYADALKPTKQGKKTLVDFETLLEHRTQNINRAASAPGAPTARTAHGRANEAALNIRAQRQLRELDIAERVGAVTPTQEVKEAAASAVAA